jgi:hypothetical protein
MNVYDQFKFPRVLDGADVLDAGGGLEGDTKHPAASLDGGKRIDRGNDDALGDARPVDDKTRVTRVVGALRLAGGRGHSIGLTVLALVVVVVVVVVHVRSFMSRISDLLGFLKT